MLESSLFTAIQLLYLIFLYSTGAADTAADMSKNDEGKGDDEDKGVDKEQVDDKEEGGEEEGDEEEVDKKLQTKCYVLFERLTPVKNRRPRSQKLIRKKLLIKWPIKNHFLSK